MSSQSSAFHPIRTLARKELSLLFNSPATYVITVFFLLLTGYLFMGGFFQANVSTLDSFLQPLPIIFTFVLPALTMRSFSEEFRSGTIEYLATLPIGDHEIVLAKYLAAMGLFGSLMVATLVYPFILLLVGRPDIGQAIGGYLSVICLGSFFTAIGLWASSLSRNQVVSFIIGFFVCFFFSLLSRISEMLPGTLGSFVQGFSVDAHFQPLARGVIDSRDLIYWASGTLFFLVGALLTLQTRRVR